MLTTVGRFFIVLIDKRGHTNACVSRSACAGHLCAKMRACEHAHIWTARALSAARTCYARIVQKNIELRFLLKTYQQ